MDVHLLAYDLSGGLARQMSLPLLGFHLDAVYHTSIELEGLEYVYDGGINIIQPGSSHLGRPLQRIHLGKAELPLEVILEYIDSLRSIYTVEAYDLFRHNCNNFSNDLATFLLGKGIPDHITNMPQAVLDSPFGRMLQPQLAQMVQERKAQRGGLLGIQDNATPQRSQPASQAPPAIPKFRPGATVKNVSTLAELDHLLENTEKSFAVIFFTSVTCPPCKTLYPLYDELASEVGNKGVLIKVDVSQAFDVGQKYSVRATPTFLTFLQGQEYERWSGADGGRLRSTVNTLDLMAHPPHQHQSLNLPTFLNTDTKPVLFEKLPPIPKLLAKMGDAAQDDSVQGVKNFVETRSTKGAPAATLPDMPKFSAFLANALQSLPIEVIFTAIDLLRCALVDARFSGYLAEEDGHKTVIQILTYVNGQANCPYALRLVALQMACNLFSSPLYPEQILSHAPLRNPVIQLLSQSFLDDSHNNVRVAASSLLYNIALANSEKRREGSEDAFPESDQVELAASVLEAITQEEKSTEALHGMLLGLGYLAYCMPADGELSDLLRVMDAQRTIHDKKKQFPSEPLIFEVGTELLGKGLDS